MSKEKTPEEVKRYKCIGEYGMDYCKKGHYVAFDDYQSLQSERDKLVEVLRECEIQIEYMHEKFKKTGSGNAVLAQISRALKPYNEKGGENG